MVPGIPTKIYETPPGSSTIVLLAQTVNTDDTTEQMITIEHRRGTDVVPIVYEYPIPPKEVLYSCGNQLGSLALEPGDSIWINGSSNDLAFIMSVMEQAL
jgi:hypothetical protein